MGDISLSVQDYAKLHDLQPQLVYYYIRKGRIKKRPCGECGREVIDPASADKVFGFNQPKTKEEKIAFRQEWDRRYEEGQRRAKEQS